MKFPSGSLNVAFQTHC